MLKVLQYSWAITAFAGLGIAIYNFVLFSEWNQRVYMPLIVSVFCVLLFFLFKSQVNSKKITPQTPNK